MSAVSIKELRERTGLGLLECKKALADSNGDIERAIEHLRKSSGIKAAKKAGRVAADGVIAAKVSSDKTFAILAEVNCETDFVARDQGFLDFVDKVLARAFDLRTTEVQKILEGALEKDRESLVQKIGENISFRRAAILNISDGMIDAYVHGNSRIAALLAINTDNAKLARDLAMHVVAVNPKVIAPDDMPSNILEKEREIFTAQALESGKSEEIATKMVSGRLNKFLAENSLLKQPFVKNPEQSVHELVNSAGAEIISFARYEVGEGIEVEKVDFAAEVAAQLES